MTYGYPVRSTAEVFELDSVVRKLDTLGENPSQYVPAARKEVKKVAYRKARTRMNVAVLELDNVYCTAGEHIGKAEEHAMLGAFNVYLQQVDSVHPTLKHVVITTSHFAVHRLVPPSEDIAIDRGASRRRRSEEKARRPFLVSESKVVQDHAGVTAMSLFELFCYSRNDFKSMDDCRGTAVPRFCRPLPDIRANIEDHSRANACQSGQQRRFPVMKNGCARVVGSVHEPVTKSRQEADDPTLTTTRYGRHDPRIEEARVEDQPQLSQ